jgi:HEAT repeat protein
LTVPALASAFEKTNSRLRIQSALALGNFGQRARPAVASLASVLHDPDPVVRAVALIMLREVDPKVWQKNDRP